MTEQSRRNVSAWQILRIFGPPRGRNGSWSGDDPRYRESPLIIFGLCLNQTIPRDKWVLDRTAFWRHSLGCALVTQSMARKIGYAEPEKAYLAGFSTISDSWLSPSLIRQSFANA